MDLSVYALFNSDCFDFTQHALWKGLNCNTASGWLGSEILGIHFVKCGKVTHICQEAGGLKYLVIAAACCFQDGAHVPAALFCLCFDSLRDGLVSRIHRDLPDV